MAYTPPWSDCKVAFGYDGNDDKLFARDAKRPLWPEGWTLVETDASGARCVAVFRVTVPLREVDGLAVRKRLDLYTRRDRSCVSPW